MRKRNRKCEEAFASALMEWNKTNRRAMPWKGEKDPYKVWLSEIILQQTRVEQGTPYYERFIKAYPNLRRLANAGEREVFRLWQGLGYYNRCKNMLAAARKIVAEYGGIFPSDYAEIGALPGVGAYTAAAIASFAYDLPYAVVDGNVQRVLARYFGIGQDVNTTAGKKYFSALASGLLDKKEPAVYNQAIMDFGATLCTPKQPACDRCPLNTCCYAFREGRVGVLPVKTGRKPLRHRYFYYFVFSCEEMVYLRHRGRNDIWENLYDFILYERDEPEDRPFLETAEAKRLLGENRCLSIEISAPYRQQLSHQLIEAVFVEVRLAHPLKGYGNCRAVAKKNLDKYAFPRVIVRYLQDEKYLEA